MFVYLSKKIAIPNGVHLRCASWNATQVRSWTNPSRPTVTFPSAGSTSDRARPRRAGSRGGDDGMLKVLKMESGR